MVSTRLPIASGVVMSTCEFACSSPEIPPYDESAIWSTVYVRHGMSPNTAACGGTRRLKVWSTLVRSPRGTLPAGYVAKRIHRSPSAVLSISKCPMKKGMSTSSW